MSPEQFFFHEKILFDAQLFKNVEVDENMRTDYDMRTRDTQIINYTHFKMLSLNCFLSIHYKGLLFEISKYKVVPS